ncbi:MAG TPA: type 1 glutamine amidotransferase domain-containing protein [Thermoleophilia bacterium]|nr:type 1 glutamine amidotransferase domain-containing protein [Thermoleophilia bacterium]
MSDELHDKRIAILFTDGVEQSELMQPLDALREAGARIDLVSIHDGQVQAMDHAEKGDLVTVDRTVDQVEAGEYEGLVLPGGVANPDKLRMNEQAVSFVRECFRAGVPIAVICHGPWTMVEAGIVNGLTMTSYPSVKTDIRNAGGHWVDRETVVDRAVVSSRNPGDLPAFCAQMIRLFAQGRKQSERVGLAA